VASCKAVSAETSFAATLANENRNAAPSIASNDQASLAFPRLDDFSAIRFRIISLLVSLNLPTQLNVESSSEIPFGAA
jgi:hypothetical protein